MRLLLAAIVAAGAPIVAVPGPQGCLTTTAVTGCARVNALWAPTSIAVSPDGRSVYVGGTASLVSFARNLKTGALRQTGCIKATLFTWRKVTGCATLESFWPSAVAVSNDGRFVYVGTSLTDHGGYEQTRFDIFARDSTTGTLRHVACFGRPGEHIRGCATLARLRLPATIAVSGADVYVGGERGLLRFRATKPVPLDVALPPHTNGLYHFLTSPDGRRAYALLAGRLPSNSFPDVLLAFERRADGTLHQMGCVSGDVLPDCTFVSQLTGYKWNTCLAIAPDGRRLYFSNGADLIAFDDALHTISMSTVGGVRAGVDPSAPALLVAPDGSAVYAAANGALRTYDASLAPRQTIRSTRVGEWVSALALSPDGHNLYVAGATGDYPSSAHITIYRTR